MTDHREDPARDRDGQLIGGETSLAPGIPQGDDLSSVVGAGATDAEAAAAGLASRRGPGGTAAGASPTILGYPAPGGHIAGTGGKATGG